MTKEKKGFFMQLLGGEGKDNKTKYYWILLLILIGMAIMIFSSFINITEQVPPFESEYQDQTLQETSGFIETSSSPKSMQDYEKIFENQITEALTDMLGVKEATVIVNLDSTEELVIEKNLKLSEQVTKERDDGGGTRDITDLDRDEQVVLYQLEEVEQPLILKTLKPKVRGVIIVVEGAENLQIKALITEAVQRFLDVPSYKIAILPKRN